MDILEVQGHLCSDRSGEVFTECSKVAMDILIQQGLRFHSVPQRQERIGSYVLS